MSSDPSAIGRSDLLVAPGATETIGVPLPDTVVSYIRANGPTTVSVTADNGLVPPCDEIAELAAGCAEFTQSPDYDLSDGDGITRIISTELTVAVGT
jgi:hypothetical protein